MANEGHHEPESSSLVPVVNDLPRLCAEPAAKRRKLGRLKAGVACRHKVLAEEADQAGGAARLDGSSGCRPNKPKIFHVSASILFGGPKMRDPLVLGPYEVFLIPCGYVVSTWA